MLFSSHFSYKRKKKQHINIALGNIAERVLRTGQSARRCRGFRGAIFHPSGSRERKEMNTEKREDIKKGWSGTGDGGCQAGVGGCVLQGRLPGK